MRSESSHKLSMGFLGDRITQGLIDKLKFLFSKILLTAMAVLITQAVAHLVLLLRALPAGVLAAIAWLVVGLGLWQLIAAGRETFRRGAALHEIPCADCQFFTNDHRLKCPVHPYKALTPEAVGCQDFETLSMAGNAIEI